MRYYIEKNILGVKGVYNMSITSTPMRVGIARDHKGA